MDNYRLHNEVLAMNNPEILKQLDKLITQGIWDRIEVKDREILYYWSECSDIVYSQRISPPQPHTQQIPQ